jgi:hypothetical protein
VAFHASKITPTHKYANLQETNGMTMLLTLPSNTNRFYTPHDWEEKFWGYALFTFNRTNVLSYNTMAVLILTTLKPQPGCPDLQDTEKQVRSSWCPNV